MRFLRAAVFSIVCVFLLSHGYVNAGAPLVPANSIFALPYLFLFYIIFYYGPTQGKTFSRTARFFHLGYIPGLRSGCSW